MIKILLADDHQLLLDGLSKILEGIPDMQLVGTTTSGQEVLELTMNLGPDVVLLDINMPGMNGVEVCKKLMKRSPDAKVIALSMYKRQSYIQRMIQFGAKGYLLKDDSSKEIEAGIRSVLQGEYYISSQLNTDLLSLLKPHSFSPEQEITPREIEVLEHISKGMTNHEIAEKMYLSQHTIESHRKNILIKLDAKNTADLIRVAIEKGLI